MRLFRIIGLTLLATAFVSPVLFCVEAVRVPVDTIVIGQGGTVIAQGSSVRDARERSDAEEEKWAGPTFWITLWIGMITVIIMILAILMGSQWFSGRKVIAEAQEELNDSKKWRQEHDVDFGILYSYLAQLQTPTGPDAVYRQIVYARLSIGRLAKYVKSNYRAGVVFGNSLNVLRLVFQDKIRSIPAIIREVDTSGQDGWDVMIGRTLTNVDEASASVSGTQFLGQLIGLKDRIEEKFGKTRKEWKDKN